MEKTINGITFKEDNTLLLSKEKINEFLEKHEEDLKKNDWEKIFKNIADVGPGDYVAQLMYTLLSLNSDFMGYINIIPAYMFHHCDFITSITIPNSVKEIGLGTFYKCTSLTSITIPTSVEKIGYVAFEYCTSLFSITIPSSVAEIEDGAFDGCTSLKTFICSKDLKFSPKKIKLKSDVNIVKV